MIAELFSIGTSVASYLEKDQEYQLKKRQKTNLLNSLNDSIIDNSEAQIRLDSISDSFNPGIMNDLNSGAVRNAISGSLNPTNYSQLIPQKAMAVSQGRQAIDSYNDEVGQKISELSLMEIPKPGFLDILSGGIQGYAMGSSIDLSMEESKRRRKLFDIFESELDNGNENSVPVPAIGNVKKNMLSPLKSFLDEPW